MKIDQATIKDNEFLTDVDSIVPLDKQDPHIIMNTARIDAALPKPIKNPLKMAPSLSFCAHTLALMVRRSKSPVHQWLRLSRKAWQARAADEDPAANGKLTGMALCVPTTDVSFMLVVICAETRRRSEVT